MRKVMVVIAAGALGAWGVACGADDGGGVGDVDAHGDVVDVSGDTGGPGDDVSGDTLEPGVVAIVSFDASYDVITRGVDHRGEEVHGTVNLSWTTHAASSVRLEADGVPVALDACVPTGAGPCHEAGRITLTPTQDRTFTLRAQGPGGSCSNGCPEDSLTVRVLPPAVVHISPDRAVVPAGQSVRVTYSASAPSWAIGRIQTADGGLELAPCVPAGEADAGAPCVLEAVAGAPLDEAGVAIFADLDRSFRVGVVADNGAEDGLGDIRIRDLETPITVPVEVRTFTATPPKLLPGASSQLVWELRGAQTVELTSPVADLTGLATCVGLGADGRGFCTAQVAAGVGLGPIPVTLVARQVGGLRSESQLTLDVIPGPAVDAFEADLAAAVPGQEVALRWTAFGADSVAVSASPAGLDGLAACDELPASGKGSCMVTVRDDATPGVPLTLTLDATHAAVGPGASATLDLDILAAPIVRDFWVDDPTVEAGATVTFEWDTDHAHRVVLTEDSGAISAAELAACAEVMADGSGSCVITVPAAFEPGDITFGLVAVGPTGARSAPSMATVSVGGRPEATLSASPTLVPEGGGDVTLTWTAAGATAVVITDDLGAEVAVSAAESGSVFVTIARSTTWTLHASNDFGAVTRTATAFIEGAPQILALSIGGLDVLAGQTAVIAATSTELAWTTANIEASDAIVLERAPLPAPNGTCGGVASGAWATAGGFPQAGSASGSAPVGDLASAAECFRFIAEDLATTPAQRDAVVFKVRKDPVVTSFTVDDDTVEPGDTVTLAWKTDFTYQVEVTVSPVGAVTSQQLAGCAAVNATGDGLCAVTMQPGTPLGDVVFSLVARGEEGATSPAATVAVTLGEGARVQSLQVSPATASAATDVTVSWTTLRGTSLNVVEGDEVIVSTTDPAEIASGSVVVPGVESSTTWTLTVANAFGAETRAVTTFIGPSIDALSANGQDALGGEVVVPTGPVTVSWTTTSANGAHRLETGSVPGGGNCAGASYAVVYEDDVDPPPSANHSLGAVTQNRCVRLTVLNDEEPPQSSTASFLLREVPEIVGVTASPSSISSSGGTVVIDMQIRGATQLSVTAQYQNAAGSSLGTRSVCNQGSLNSGSLSGSANVDQVQCAHTITPCNLLCLNNGMPSGTARVRYTVTVSDPEGDSATFATSGAGDVTVN